MKRPSTPMNLKQTLTRWLAVVPFFGLCLLLLSSYGLIKNEQSADDDSLPPLSINTKQLNGGLHSPTAMAFPGNGDIWVTEQTGLVRVFKSGKLQAEPLLDLRSKMFKINSGYEERGLLGIALNPRFSTNRKFYVFYSAPSTQKSDHKGIVAEYTASGKSGGVDVNSGRVVMSVEEPESNHNGGCIQFGKDGYLYISLGDGGGQGDKHGEFGSGQNMNTWLGKILRVNVDTKTGYLIPKGNPFAGKSEMKPEIWAYGFRNPYRFSFDKVTGELFAGDVGQDKWEEVDIVKKGANYGWRTVEGTHCYNPAEGCKIAGITMPITEYSHKVGISVIGGYVYRGRAIPALASKYVFADWAGPIFYLQKMGSNWERGRINLQNTPKNLKIIGFGEDPAGEIYVMANPDTGPENAVGVIYKLAKF